MAESAVLLGTYNGEKYLREQLDSLLEQTYQDFICYIHDDGSNDATQEIICSYERKYPGKFRRVFYKSEGGAAANFLNFITYAVNELDEKYYFFSDQDDVWLPQKMKKQVEAVKKIENEGNVPALSYTDQCVVDENLRTLASSSRQLARWRDDVDSFKKLLFSNPAPGCTMCLNRELLLLSAQYGDKKSIFMHDWWVLYLARCYGSLRYIDEPLMLYRQHGNNVCGAHSGAFLDRSRKYFTHFFKSIADKKAYIRMCEAQIVKIAGIKKHSFYRQEMDDILTILKKPWLFRAIFFMKNGYLSAGTWFTCFFV